MELMSEYKLKNIVKKACQQKALHFLNLQKGSKTEHIVHENLQMQNYLKPTHEPNIKIQEIKFLFSLR